MPGPHFFTSSPQGFADLAARHVDSGAQGPSDTYRIAVQLEVHGKGGARCLHDELAVGSTIEMTGPFNSFPLHAMASSRVSVVAGGIGVTPLVSMAHALRAQGIPFELHRMHAAVLMTEERTITAPVIPIR
ncbi:hypothetical protein AB4Z48_34465 [Cupriavidus sp. 2TAF22]|uniref:hypothetical protein n=1 Tax=unclassified Cupriavidus TaxID=2640874 RepID=UPI003F91F261